MCKDTGNVREPFENELLLLALTELGLPASQSRRPTRTRLPDCDRMEKVCGLHLGSHDIFINVAGGVKLDEPAVDLGIISSLMSSFLNRPIDAGTVVCGEVGLTGEVRTVGRMEERIKEAARMGFSRCILPGASSNGAEKGKQMTRVAIGTIKDLSEHLFV